VAATESVGRAMAGRRMERMEKIAVLFLRNGRRKSDVSR
jgi:hypothetical protein